MTPRVVLSVVRTTDQNKESFEARSDDNKASWLHCWHTQNKHTETRRDAVTSVVAASAWILTSQHLPAHCCIASCWADQSLVYRSATTMSQFNIGQTLRYRNLLVVIKQTAYEEYSQVRIWSEIEQTFVQCIVLVLSRMVLMPPC